MTSSAASRTAQGSQCLAAPRPSISFASDVICKLQANARELSKEAGIQAFCSSLEGELANVWQHLEELGDEPGKVDEERLLKLLGNLERLCQVSLLVGALEGHRGNQRH